MKKKTHRNKRDKEGYEYDFDGVNAKDLVKASAAQEKKIRRILRQYSKQQPPKAA